MSGDQTALIVVPRAELVLAEKKAAEQDKRAGSNQWKCVGSYILGSAAVIGAITSAHVIVPLLVGGMILDACSLGGLIHYMCKHDAYKNQQAATKAAQEQERNAVIAAAADARIEALRLAAESILMRNTGYAAGQELRVDSAGETPKILRIELVGAVVDDNDRPARKISARFYEAVAQADGGLKRGERVANVPEIVYTVPLDPSPGSSADASLAPASPSGGIEKKLPPGPRMGG